jgi:hypothetical protein
MKTLALLVIALLAVIGWQYTKLSDQDSEIRALADRIASLENKPKPPSPTPAPTPAADQLRHVICPLCDGQRVLIYTGNESKSCPLCINSVGVPMGYRNVRVPPGYQICTNCRGMGLVVTKRSTHPPQVENCALCGGTGVIPIAR